MTPYTLRAVCFESNGHVEKSVPVRSYSTIPMVCRPLNVGSAVLPRLHARRVDDRAPATDRGGEERRRLRSPPGPRGRGARVRRGTLAPGAHRCRDGACCCTIGIRTSSTTRRRQPARPFPPSPPLPHHSPLPAPRQAGCGPPPGVTGARRRSTDRIRSWSGEVDQGIGMGRTDPRQ